MRKYRSSKNKAEKEERAAQDFIDKVYGKVLDKQKYKDSKRDTEGCPLRVPLEEEVELR